MIGPSAQPSINAYKILLEGKRALASSRNCLILGDDGKLSVATVVAPATARRAASGAPDRNDARRRQQEATLADFRSALIQHYGDAVGRDAYQSVRTRHALLFTEAVKAIRVASQRADSIRSGNQRMLAEFLDEPRAAEFHHRASLPRAAHSALVTAMIGPALSQVQQTEEQLRAKIASADELCSLGLGSDQAETLRSELLATPLAQRDRQVNREMLCLAVEAEIRRVLKDTHADRKAGPRVYHEDDIDLCRALAHAAVAPDSAHPLPADQIRAAVSQAQSLLRILEATPDLSEARARHILYFAARAPLALRHGVVEALCRDRQGSFDKRGVAIGSAIGACVAAGFDMTEQLGELRAALIPSAEEAAKMQQAYARADGSGSYLLSNAACKEASRSTFIVDQHALPRSNAVVFAPRFRDAFPEGAFGDELAQQASHLMNPDKLDTLIKRVHEMACMPTVFKACTTLHEAWPRKDGVWALRTTLRWDISAARLPATDATAHHFAAPAAALFTVDYRIIPGLLKSAPLNVYCTKAEVVFASATAPSATSEAAT